MSFKSITLAITVLLLSANANAALVSADLSIVGDGLITRDTNSGMEWLDLTESQNYSYNYVSSQFGIGGQFEGWRYATSSEVDTLLDNAGGTGPYDGDSTVNNGIGEPLLELWGKMYTSTNNSWSEFIIADVYGVNQHWYGQVWDRGSTVDFIDIMQAAVGDSTIYSRRGSALIRETSVVPVPAAVWLFGSGLLGLVGVARHKQSV
jgi:hypothetical protein